MRWFSFFTKLVFICNCCFLFAVAMQFFNVEDLPQWMIGTVLTLGWFLSVLLNLVFLSLTVFFLLRGKSLSISPALGLLNILISVFQFIYFIVLK